ncbi:contact-dependent growth inhibition system immunity protein [Oricola sp.]|uniref:contact-dependent growth inhibition system immunity protein n=1 Tax=Oricola sp. TaxID=1979950 RepID=UPI0025CC046F|nr:contact-dependent growth inhibition system immunity protein [Oricola sp.]MCI5076263.1 contact-dependent growth inhibition system immunity protein [Oricola sp.]
MTQSIEDIEKDYWGEPEFASRLVSTCHALRRKPLDRFTVEDLRVMIGQNLSLPILMPMALDRLRADPLAEGDHYPGDLLFSVLRCRFVAEAAWADTHETLKSICERAVVAMRQLIEDDLCSCLTDDPADAAGLDREAMEGLVSQNLDQAFKGPPMSDVAAFLNRAAGEA